MSIKFLKRIKIYKGLVITVSKSRITPSYRTEKGTISSKGYSIKTGISGLSYRKAFRRKKSNGCLASILLFILIPLLAVPTSCKTDTPAIKPHKDTIKWYHGGNLQKPTIKTWKAVTENKLTTCIDFCSNYYKTLDLANTKVVVTILKMCINEAVKAHDNSKVLFLPK